MIWPKTIKILKGKTSETPKNIGISYQVQSWNIDLLR